MFVNVYLIFILLNHHHQVEKGNRFLGVLEVKWVGWIFLTNRSMFNENSMLLCDTNNKSVLIAPTLFSNLPFVCYL